MRATAVHGITYEFAADPVSKLTSTNAWVRYGSTAKSLVQLYDGDTSYKVFVDTVLYIHMGGSCTGNRIE